MKSIKQILFLYFVPPLGRGLYTQMNFGVGILLSILKKYSVKVSFKIISTDKDIKLPNFHPDIIFISAFSSMIKLVEKYADLLKKQFPHTFILLGGIHARVASNSAAKIYNIDGIIAGEGETFLIKLLEKEINLKDIFKKNKIFMPAPVADLNMLPFPDRTVFNQKNILKQYGNIIGAEFLIGRGCPFSCTFCANEVINKSSPLYKKIRIRKVENILKEIQLFCGQFGKPQLIGFHDDIFPLNPAWLDKFVFLYKKEINIPFWANMNIAYINSKLLKKLKKAGCIRLHCGVETGDEKLRKEILNKNISNDKIIEAFKLMKDSGFKTVAFLMLGIPYETEESIRTSIKLFKKLKPFRTIVSIFTPFPGTTLYKLCLKNKWKINYAKPNYYETEPALEQPSISSKKLFYYYNNILKFIYSNSNNF